MARRGRPIVSARIDRELEAAIRAHAARAGVDLAEAVRRALATVYGAPGPARCTSHEGAPPAIRVG